MAFFLEKGQNFFLGDPHGLVGYFVVEIGHTQFGPSLYDSLLDLLFEALWHPDHTQEPAISKDEFALGDVELRMPDKTRRGGPAAHDTGKGRKLHTAGGFTSVIPVDGHTPVT